MARTGVSRPLESLWDLIPFSFVVDYFTRTGEMISQLSDKLTDQEGLVGKVGLIYSQWECQKAFRGIQFDLATTAPKWDTTVKQNLPGSQATYGWTTFTRYPTAVSPLLSSVWDNDFLKVNLSSTRKRTLAELVIQAKLR